MEEKIKTEKHFDMPPKRKRLLQGIGAVFILITIIYILYYLLWGQFHEYTDDAYVDGNLVQVMPRVSGTVIKINTEDTSLVNQGDPVVQLDNSDARVDLAHAAANLALTVRRVRQLYDNAELAEANISLQKSNLDKAQFDLKRRQALTKGSVISSEELQHYSIAMHEAQSQLQATQAQAASAIALVENASLYNHPEVLNAKANYETAFLNLQRTTVLAPITGYVAKRSVQVGQQVTTGTPLLAIIPLNDLWVNANYKESQLERIRIGQPVTMDADAYSGFTFHGKVIGLSSGTGSAFDLLPPQNATGNWIKIVQRLPVRISIDAKELQDHPLRIGLSVRVTTNTFHTNGNVLSPSISKPALYGTDIYAHELALADQEANKIIQSNAPDIIFTPPVSTLLTPRP